MFCAYVHARPDAADAFSIFYVGKGTARRAQNFKRRNPHHSNIIKKYGVENISVGMLECSSEQIAFELEKGLIKCLRRMGVELANQTDGGEGTLGVVVSEHSRKLRSENGKRNWAVADFREKVSSKLRNTYAPHAPVRVKIGQAVKKKLAEPEVKVRHIKGIRNSKTEEVKRKTSETLKAQRASPEYRSIMSKRMKNVCEALEDRSRLSKATKGKIWITDGVIGRRVYPDAEIPAGFWRGKPDKRRKQKLDD